MKLTQYLEAITNESLPDYTWQYGRNTDFNIEGDNVASPVVLLIEPDQSFLNTTPSGNIYKGFNAFLRFMQTLPEISLGDKAPSRDDAIEAQEAAAIQFINTLQNDDNFIDLRTPIPMVRVIEAYDGSWYGVEINLQNLQFNIPEIVCP